MQNGAATLENSLTISNKLEHSSYNPAILLLNIYPREIENSTRMFKAAQFLTTKNCKLEYPSIANG